MCLHSPIPYSLSVSDAEVSTINTNQKSQLRMSMLRTTRQQVLSLPLLDF